jgi:3-hydroxybutyrate dehydrogenase
VGRNVAAVNLLDSCIPASAIHISAVRHSSKTPEFRKGAIETKFLDNRVALVTGSTSGIGLGVARSLAARGSRILLNGFGDEKLIKSLQDEFSNVYKVKADYIPVDLSKESDIESYVRQIKVLYPRGIDILVNNAGFQHVSPVEEFPVEKWNGIIAVLLSAPFHLIRLLLPDMRQRGWGRIINLASVHSVRASPFKAAYVSAKHGLAGLTKVVALETAGSGVTCNAVSPGFVDTPILQMQVQALADREKLSYTDAKAKFLATYHPSKDAVGIDQIGEMITFLCTDAASQTTGSNVIIDGGWCAK